MTSPRSERFPFLAPLDPSRTDALALHTFALRALRDRLDELAADYPDTTSVDLFFASDVPLTTAMPRIAGFGDAATRSVLGGPAPMLAGRHPWSAGRPLGHLMTLRTDALPSLRAAFPDAAAVSLFCNELPRTPRNRRYVSVLPIDAATLAGGFCGLGAVRPPYAVESLSVAVPAAVFQPARRRKDPRLERLFTRLGMLPGRAGGAPAWIAPETAPSRFLFQMDGALGGLTDAPSILYAFEDDFFLQIA